MDLKPSDVAKLAAGITAGYFTSSYVQSLIEDDDDDAIESLLKTVGASATGGLAGSIVSDLMDETGISDTIDDIFGF